MPPACGDVLRAGQPVPPPHIVEHMPGEPALLLLCRGAQVGHLPLRPVLWCTRAGNQSLRPMLWGTREGALTLRPVLMS